MQTLSAQACQLMDEHMHMHHGESKEEIPAEKDETGEALAEMEKATL